MTATYHLFERFGIEIEYMIVNQATLAVESIADRLIKTASGSYENEIKRGPISWSNELALHCIELKCAEPVTTLAGLDEPFMKNIQEINRMLAKDDALLLGTGMHPFMNPHNETKLWPHGYHAVYKTFDRIFSCNRHGWSNLQSVHLNLPFANDDEFARLHSAIRLVLPIIPALAASSPLMENRLSGFLDTRMEVYRSNGMRIPIITGEVIPEPVFSREEYLKTILEPIYFELAPFDPDGILREEWVNARGAIARFERNTIEIRIIDTQETPRADLAIASAVAGALRLLTDERLSSFETQKPFDTGSLKTILLDTIQHGEQSAVNDLDYCAALGYEKSGPTAGDLWKHLIDRIDAFDPGLLAPHHEPLSHILSNGTLATRIITALNHNASWKTIDAVYRRLTECLSGGELLERYIDKPLFFRNI
jgi:carboxylate-amine ligase